MSAEPPGRATRGPSVRTLVPFVVFVAALGVWTWELLAENPVPESVHRLIPDGWHFWLAKGLHVVAYAFLTVLAATLPLERVYFWMVVSLLVLHGIATEVGQNYVAGRTGSLRDVLLDWAGVAGGVLVVWWFGVGRRGGGDRGRPASDRVRRVSGW